MSDQDTFAPSTLRRLWQQWRNELGLIVAILFVIGLTLCFNRAYWLRPTYNATEILRQTSLLGIFALGAAIVIISGGIDLSSGAVIAFSGAICAQIFLVLSPVDSRRAPDTSHLGPLVISAGIGGALLAGFLIGTLHTWLITIVGLPPFVATLASLVGLRSLAKVLNIEVTKRLANQSIKININDPSFTYLGKQWWIPLSVFLVLGTLAWVLLSRMVIGRHLYAMGGNEQAARLSGIRTDRLKWLAYVIGAMTASIAGVLYTAEVSAVDPQTQGRGYELNAIAAAVVGGCSLQGGVGQVSGVMLGVLFLRVVIDAVAKIVGSGSDDYEGLIVGFLVVLAVAFNAIRSTSGAKRKEFFPGVLGWITIPMLALLAGSIGVLTAGDRNGAMAGLTVLVVLSLIKFVESRANR